MSGNIFCDMVSHPVLQIPVGSGKAFSGVVDLLTNQKLLWKPRSLEDDGRLFESRPLDESDDAELLQEVKEARTALIEQVQDMMLRRKIYGF